MARYRRSKLDSLLLLRREAVDPLFYGARALHAAALAVDGIVAAQLLRAERVGEAGATGRESMENIMKNGIVTVTYYAQEH